MIPNMHDEMALKRDGTTLGVRINLLSDNGRSSPTLNPPSSERACSTSLRTRMTFSPPMWVTDGAYTHKAPGGVAYRCSFKVTEASYLIKRLVQDAAYE